MTTQEQDPKADARFDALRDNVRGSRPRAASEWEYFTSGDDTRLFVERWMPPEPPERVALCFHGMSAHGRYYALLADALVPRGIGVVACDMRGHGLSDGARGDIEDPKRLVADARQVYAAVRARYPQAALFTVGESMGGALNANLAMSAPAGLRGAIFLSPAIAPALHMPLSLLVMLPVYALAAVFASRAKIVRVSGREREGMNNDLNVDYDRNDPLHIHFACIRYMRGVKWLMDQARAGGPQSLGGPILIFQGGNDAAVSPAATKQFFEALRSQDKTLKFYDKAKHCMLSDPVHGPMVFDTIIEWIEKR